VKRSHVSFTFLSESNIGMYIYIYVCVCVYEQYIRRFINILLDLADFICSAVCGA